ncbi:MAG: DUF2683 family protein [Candidatus Micrarchaeota archaeon]
MVNALVNISDGTNRVLNIIKARNGLNTKSQAIDTMAREYEMELLEPQLRPEYVKKLKRIMKEKTRRVDDFEKEFLSG